MATQDLAKRFQKLRTTESDTPTEVDAKKQLDLSAAKKLLAALDQEISKLLNEQCCTPQQTAQFMNYISSTPCISICETEDIPPHKWGGWYQSRFMMLFIRTLKETMERMKLGQDKLLEKEMLRVLENELQIAVGTFHSAKVGEQLEAAKRDLDLQGKRVQELQRADDSAQGKLAALDSQIQHLDDESSHFIQVHAATKAEYDRALQAYQSYKKLVTTNNPYYTGHPLLRKLFVTETVADDEEEANKRYAKVMKLDQSLRVLSASYHHANQQQTKNARQYQDQQDIVKDTRLQLVDAERKYDVAQAHFSKLLYENEIQLFNCVTRLNIGQHHRHAIGFIGHAIFAGFRNTGSHIRVKIGNLGLGANKYHFSPPGRGDLILPYVLDFPNTEVGRAHLRQFCHNITLALTKDKDEALELIYAKFDEVLSKEKHWELQGTFDIAAELPQWMGNCAAKGYLHLLRERMLEERPSNKEDQHKRYRRLMMSLYVWSKQAYLLRQSIKSDNLDVLPRTWEEFFTQANVDALRNSEHVFDQFAQVEQYLTTMRENILGLTLRPPKEPSTETGPENTRVAGLNLFTQNSPYYSGISAQLSRAPLSQRNASEPAPLATMYNNTRGLQQPQAVTPYVDFGFSDSSVNAPQYSETTLKKMLFKQPDSPESPKRRRQRDLWG